LIVGAGVILIIFFHVLALSRAYYKEYYYPGVALYNKGDYSGAEAVFRHMIANRPVAAGDFPGRAKYELGKCLLQEGRLDEARQEFEEARSECANGHVEYPCYSRSEAALGWIGAHSDWRPSPPNEPAASSGPPQEFPKSPWAQ